MSDETTAARDWHAHRAGWTFKVWDNGGEGWRREHPDRREYEYHEGHPMPNTLDGAASAMPPGWEWRRYGGEGWRAFTTSGELLQANVPDTGNEIHDRYLLAKLAWEQEVSNG
jgi:hypothetical protein